jgi:penicillin amidase
VRKKFLKFAAIFAFFFLLGIGIFLFFSFYVSLPKTKGKVQLKGLISDVQIIWDRWGIPHIFAQNEKDLFFATGFIHAQERMWQMEITRRAGFGRLSEIFGRMTLERDKFLRNLGLKEAAQRDYESLAPEMKELLLSYSQGVNSWILSRKFNWPPEFLLLRLRPEPWNVIDTIIIKEIMALLLSVDYASEVVREKLVKKLGPQKALKILEEGVEIPSTTSEEPFSSAEIRNSFLFQGSNNWVLSGSRTQSEKPLLANDPHLEISLPPVWYEVQLYCPSMNVTGVTFPGVPLVILGHNQSIAWGMTNSGADVQDLYIEKLDSSKEKYFDGDGWRSLTRKEEIILVRGAEKPEKLDVLWTERGPIISPIIIDSRVPYSLKWTIYEGGKTFEAVYLLNKAQNWKNFAEALKYFNAPSQNFVYADTHGDIGYYLSGKIPLRAKEVGLFPYPGWKEEGKWQGFLEEGKKPTIHNPAEGVIVTANNKITPDDYPYYISCDWDAPFRAERIKELLLKQEKHSVESLKRIQNDVYSKNGELFLPLIRELKGAEGNAAKAQAVLKDWNFEMTSGKEAALFEVFMDFFHEEALKDELGEDFKSFDSLFRRKWAGLLRILSDPLSPWFDNKGTARVEDRAEIVKISLAKAYEWLEKNYGTQDHWDWMKMHSIKFQHELGQVPLFWFFNRGPYPMNGDPFTVRASFSKIYKTTHGASFRQIIDLSNLKNSISVITSGESGHFLSRHYGDQISLWLGGQYHPMLFERKDIQENASGILTLKPKE